jgi:hypothetical protein
MHPAVLAVILAGLLLWTWSLLANVTTEQWILFGGLGLAVAAVVARRGPS